MRIRSTKPEFWRSERVASVSWDARLVLKGLESYVDDNGVGVDDLELIATEVFPRDTLRNTRETLARLSEAITQLHRAGLVWRYEAAGKHLLFISFWEQVQRIDKPSKGRFPRPDGTMAYRESEIRESVASIPESFAPGTEEQGNRGTGESPTAARTEQHEGGSQLDARAATPAAALVRECVPRTLPAATRTALRIHVGEMLNTGTPENVVREALTEWVGRTGVGPGVLPSIAADVIKRREGHATGQPHGGKRQSASDAAFAAVQALKSRPMPTLPGGEP